MSVNLPIPTHKTAQQSSSTYYFGYGEKEETEIWFTGNLTLQGNI